MAFPWILQGYIFREMGKTFLLTAVGLTGVLGLGGGVLNMMKLGEVTPDQLLRLMSLVLPIAVALTLPIAALFGAAATYGRLSADNEFVACRSSGINLHVLFLPTIVLSLASAAVTFVLINFLIPGMLQNLDQFFGTEIGSLIERRLDRPRGLTLPGGYRVYADESVVDLADANHILLNGVAFVVVEHDDWVRFGTARQVNLRISRQETRTKVSAVMTGLSFYDREEHQFFEEAEQHFPENEIPNQFSRKIKFLNLGGLLYHWANPSEWREVGEALDVLRARVGGWMVYRRLRDDWIDERELTLSDDISTYVIRSQAAYEPQETGIKLEGVSVEENRRNRRRSFMAESAYLRITRGRSLAESGVEIELYDVRATDGDRTFLREKAKLGPVAIPDEFVTQVQGLSWESLMAPLDEQVEGDPLAKTRVKVEDALAETSRRIAATISERFAFTISVFVLVILGAVLGIVFRGAHAVTAFGISFVPSLLVIVTIVMGKQMAQNAATHELGLLVMWSGIIIVAALDGWTLTRVLRR